MQRFLYICKVYYCNKNKNMTFVSVCYAVFLTEQSIPPAPKIKTSGQSQLLAMLRVLVVNFQPIRFVRFNNESMNCGLPVLEAARGLNPWHSPNGLQALGTRL